ncbi:ankyrin, partial [Lizonia empirigonia]
IPLSTSDEEMVTWLLDHGADPNSRCEWDLTPTSYAMLKAPLEIIGRLFQRGADPCCGQLLHYAVLRDKPDALVVVRLVVEKGAPINEVKYEKDLKTYSERKLFGLGTPLHRAAEFGKLDIVRYLLENGANPLKRDSKERTPRFWAEKRSPTEVARLLEEAEKHWLQRENFDSSKK